MKTKETCETQKKKRINLLWNRKKNRIDSSTILINGILFTCIILSIASGFIDLTFFSGLSKSLFHVGTIPIPAAVLYTVISIGFILAKFWCAMQIGMIKELKTRLLAKGKDWANGLKKALLPWQIVHKFLIAVSIITALSLSVNSIGAGIRKMEQNIKNMSYDAEQLLELQHSVRDGNKDMRDLLGGKGANLAYMTNSGFPVPYGFTITSEACNDYFKSGNKISEVVKKEILSSLEKLESKTGKKLGSVEKPLLVSVRSGARISMPGMLDTILNLGMNDEVCASIAKLTRNPKFAYDSYRRLIYMFANVVKNKDISKFEKY